MERAVPLPTRRPLRSELHHHVHLATVALALIALPWSEFLLSLALILMLANWIWEGIALHDLRGRSERAVSRPGSAVFLSFFALYLLGLAWTTDLKWGLDLCRILLPVPVFGLVLASLPRLQPTEWRKLLLLGAWSTTASTVACFALRHEVLALGNYRDLSPFISHIRLSLMLCLAVATFVHFRPQRLLIHAAQWVAIGWCLWFLYLLSTLIAPLVLAALALFLAWRTARRRPLPVRAAIGAVLGLAALAATLFIFDSIQRHYHADPGELDRLDRSSAGGEVYYHDLRNPQLENGHYVWINVADKELERTWDRRSKLSFTGKDKLGQPLRATLIRYLASMGQRKDSIGVRALAEGDVRRIEQGITSVAEGRQGALQARIDQVLYEFEIYRKGGDPSGHSVTMRLEFVRTGLGIAKAHWPFGVGTGDTQLAFNEAYQRNGSPLDARWRLRAHNEYLTLLISFGLPGFLWCLFSWWWPAWRNRACAQPLFTAWAIIFLLSCFSEDTLETQMGATFFALYYALFVFAAPPIPEATPAHAPPGSA
jgi:hypothetical protein